MDIIDPGWLSLLPPLAAILLALITREVVVSLFAGIWLGSLFLANWNPVSATLMSVDRFVFDALANPATGADHVSIIMFSLLLGGMVGVMSRSGGTLGMVEAMRPYATSRRRGQFLTWLAGILIFFDDYANTLIVGNTFRPITDRLKISREKLSYVVDSTAAPMAAIALISTWVGFEISLIGDSLTSAAGTVADNPAEVADLLEAASNPINVFIHSIPFLFYPIFALLFVLMTVVTKREFGPMHAAEQRAISGGGLHRPDAQLAADTGGGLMDAPEDKPHRWYNAAAPVLITVVVALVGILVTGAQNVGADAGLREIVGGADPFKALIWASFVGSLTAIVITWGQRILSLQEAIEAWVGGMRAMMLAIIILVLAWGLGGLTQALGTGPYLSHILSDTLPIHLLPALTFLTAAVISFATGTSWGTMSILFPVVVPLAVAMGAGIGFEEGSHYTILLGVVSGIMAGAIFGDHCSPISDTTVMSSMASASDHVDHVRTQLPYAVTVALVGMFIGDIPTAYGVSPAISLPVGIALLYLILRIFGKPVVGDVEPVENVENVEPV